VNITSKKNTLPIIHSKHRQICLFNKSTKISLKIKKTVIKIPVIYMTIWQILINKIAIQMESDYHTDTHTKQHNFLT